MSDNYPIARDLFRVKDGKKKCTVCLEVKDVTCFSPNGRGGKGIHPSCKPCRSTRKTPLPRGPITTKKCPRCNIVKDLVEFTAKNGRGENKSLWSYCRICNKEISKKTSDDRIASGEAVILYKKAYKKKRWVKLFRQYGISREEYERLEAEQEFLCAICGERETATYKGVLKRLCVDHDHTTKKVRALLCRHCNIALGNMKESVENLKKAIAYLEKHKER